MSQAHRVFFSEGGWSWVLELAIGFCLPEGLRRFYIFILRRTAEKIGALGDLVCGLVECSRSTEARFYPITSKVVWHCR